VPRAGNGWTTAAEHSVFIQLSVYGQIEKAHQKASGRIQTKINHLNTTLFIFGLIIGSFGIVDTYFGDSTPVWLKILQLMIGYGVSVITQVQTKNKNIARMEVLKEIAAKCAYRVENIKNILHMSKNARPPADTFILSINTDIECLKISTPILDEMPDLPELPTPQPEQLKISESPKLTKQQESEI